MTPVWLLDCEGVTVGGAVGGMPAEDVLAEDVLAEDVRVDVVAVDTPEAPKIAPGPYSGVSILNVDVRP
jgi:hypothetical protein